MNLGARQLLPFAQVRESVRCDDAGKWDEIVPRRNLWMRDGELVWDAGGEERRLTLSPLAENHLATRLGIPAHYYRALPPILKDQNANFWLKAGSTKSLHHERARDNEKWRLRCKFGTIRAVLSESYSPLDNGPLCENLAGLLAPQHQINWFGLSDEKFHLHVVDPLRVREVLPGDDYFCGVYVGNSEVGAKSVQVEAYLMRLVCSNGMVAVVDGQSLMRRRHIHIEAGKFQSTLREAFSQAPLAADGFIKTLRRTTTEIVPDPKTTLEKLGERLGISETTQHTALAAIAREAPCVQETTYGLLQGLTKAAQLLPDTSRHDLEVLAGQLAASGVPKWALRPEENEDWSPMRSARNQNVAVMA